MVKAKLVREIPQGEGLPWYFRKYELECIDCGEHFRTGRYDSRTSPYCWRCQKIHDKEKAKERAKRKKQTEINEVLDKIMSEINFICEGNGVSHIHVADVEKIIGRYKGEEEC